jgi:hypothetical protein
MIYSLLLAIAGCSDNFKFHQRQELENAAESGDKLPDYIDQEKTEPEENKPEGAESEETKPEENESGETDPEDPEEPEETKPEENEQEETEPEETYPKEPEPIAPAPNKRNPKMVINELRTEYNGKTKRTEFVEFKAKSAGNLEGLKLFIKWDAKKPFEYAFPAIRVKTGDYITLHLRTLEDDCADELGLDLSLSGGNDSNPEAHDLWVSGNKKLLHKTDIVYLQDASGGIMDAVILNEEPDETWPSSRQHFEELTEFLFIKNAWKSAAGAPPGPLDSVDTSGIKTAITRSVSRHEEVEDSDTADDWHVTDIYGATPGEPNWEPPEFWDLFAQARD